MVIAGAKEQEAATISVRERDGKVRYGVKPDAFAEELRTRVASFE
jgi:threonyl-tRNA synthetase